MNYEKIGPVEIIMGENNSRTPFSTSLVIHGRNNSTMIDCGSGEEICRQIQKQYNVEKIYLTHHHSDHTRGIHIFPHAKKFINPLDHIKVLNVEELVKVQGFHAVLDETALKEFIENKKSVPPEDKPSLVLPLDIKYSYSYNEEFDCSGTKVMMLHAPGHTSGYCCPYLPEHGILFVGDFDLTSFGPFYMDADGDIDAFIKSAYMTLEVDAKYYVTAHQKGVKDADEYKRELMEYVHIIDRRDEKIKQCIRQGIPMKDLIYQEIFYYKQHLGLRPFFIKSEKIGIAKHLKRLINMGEPLRDAYEEFLLVHRIKEEFLEYKNKNVLCNSSRS